MINNSQRQILEAEITRILNDCVSMCADYVTCFDEDEHIYSDVWEGPGPNYYYRDKIMTLINEFLEKELMDMDGVDDRRDDSGKYEVSHD